jgi:hypothetical protein
VPHEADITGKYAVWAQRAQFFCQGQHASTLVGATDTEIAAAAAHRQTFDAITILRDRCHPFPIDCLACNVSSGQRPRIAIW